MVRGLRQGLDGPVRVPVLFQSPTYERGGTNTSLAPGTWAELTSWVLWAVPARHRYSTDNGHTGRAGLGPSMRFGAGAEIPGEEGPRSGPLTSPTAHPLTPLREVGPGCSPSPSLSHKATWEGHRDPPSQEHKASHPHPAHSPLPSSVLRTILASAPAGPVLSSAPALGSSVRPGRVGHLPLTALPGVTHSRSEPVSCQPDGRHPELQYQHPVPAVSSH